MKKQYKYTLKKDHYFYNEHLKNVIFRHEFFECVYGNCVIKKGYSWDGCTFAPDFKETYTASLIHDVLYQFNIVDREKADLVFYEILKQNGFRFAKIYYFAVRLFGGLFY